LGFSKRLLGEVDPFRVDVSHEIYAHMNINYVKSASVPPASDWSPVFNSIRDFDYFTTTGEVLIHSWAVSTTKNKVTANLEWTFPMAFAEITWGEGNDIKTKTIQLNDTKELNGNIHHYEWPVDLSKAKWVRFEAWDIARNGAFTPTKWLTIPARTLNPIVYSFSFVNGDNGAVIPEYDPVREGATIEMSKLPTHNIKIRANSNLMASVNVQLGYDTNSNVTIVKSFPYQSTFDLTPGKHKVSATPSIGNITGALRTVSFNIK